MNQLVIMKNDEVVTNSLYVAESFEKRHDHIIRDVKALEKDIPNFGEMFHEGETPDSYGRPRKTYFMNRDGFTLLAMGFTGSKAMEFKLKYIEAFNAMEKQLKQPGNTKLLLKAALEQEERIEVVETDVKYLKENMRIDGSQEQELRERGKLKVLSALGGYDSNAYRKIGRKVFPQLWGEFKRHFKVPRYGDIQKSKLDDAFDFIEEWTPSTSLKLEIKELNNQQHLKLVN